MICKDIIRRGLEVFTSVVPFKEATEIESLRQMFGERYPPRVRVVSIGAPIKEVLDSPKNKKWFSNSIELCGGTHIRNTKDAEDFIIISEEAVSGGVRRLVAVTGKEAKHVTNLGEALEADIRQADRLKGDELSKALSKLHDDVPNAPISKLKKEELKKKLKKLDKKDKGKKKRVAKENRAKAQKWSKDAVESKRFEGSPFIIDRCDLGLDVKALETTLQYLVNKGGYKVPIMMFSVGKPKILAMALLPKGAPKIDLDAWIKCLKPVMGGGGGAKKGAVKGQAFGDNVAKIEEAMKASRDFIQKALG